MTGTRDMDERPSIIPDLNSNPKAKVAGPRTTTTIDGDLGRAWVRLKLGQNRGEIRPYHGTTAGFDALLDQRLTAKS